MLIPLFLLSNEVELIKKSPNLIVVTRQDTKIRPKIITKFLLADESSLNLCQTRLLIAKKPVSEIELKPLKKPRTGFYSATPRIGDSV